MGNIFTRAALNEIMANEALSADQRMEQVFALFGRALEDGYVSKAMAGQAQQTALQQARAEWERDFKAPDVRQSGEYKALQSQFDAYRAMQEARLSEDYKDVKPKFFEMVYGMVDHGDGAKSVQEQLAGIRESYEEYFIPAWQAALRPAVFGASLEGSMPKGDKGAAQAIMDAWGFGK